MIQHLPDLTRPETELERIIRELEPMPPDDLPQRNQPVQVPGFRDPSDPRIPAALRQAAVRQAQRQAQRYKGWQHK